MLKRKRPKWWKRFILPRPAAWTSIIVRKVGDGPLIYLPPRWRKRLQRPWRKWLVVGIQVWVIVPWTGFVLHFHTPPERIMTDFERQDGAQAIAIRRMRERDPYWLTPYERWSAVWARAQIAADARARARGEGGSDNGGTG